ncbi:methyltransferase domain-containing protein [Xanthomonas hortorum pv. pelargonii]|uniref:class I SAM-dependent methyltransferase n=1 Tax=Xanthomonas hortorum TaxID=56454 RepID=UPI0021C8CAC2|nr:methyltransferase domain-containing protein [Xanthomonas hortorum]MCU1707915.1 methyltransferase domain-containing protein [Xanthomonas hortorum pv. pelargonii]WOB31202.1 methyltransferase domain-containing protein [Xanthomonas hortorum pv. pelargonii]
MARSYMTSFFREWITAPCSVAAIIPSGRALASIITSELSARTGRVLELGPGTGVFTQAMIDKGVQEKNLVLLEYNATFSALLTQRFPRASLLQMDVCDLESLPRIDGAYVDAVVCGLGLLNMPAHQVAAILRGAFLQLKPGGRHYLFTYGFKCSVPAHILDALDLEAVKIGRTYRNVPPATTYRIQRRTHTR